MTSSSDRRPPEDDIVIWRYLNDWKFRQLLGKFAEHDKWKPKTDEKVVYKNEPGQLWFSYPWTYGDDLEGSMPDANKDPKYYCDEMAKRLCLSAEEAEKRKRHFLSADTQTLQECVLAMASICGVSCWHENNSESRGMWKAFVRKGDGVAIRTTVGKLIHGLQYAYGSLAKAAKPSLASIKYVNHKDFFLPADGFRSLLGIIRKKYSYQNEIRLIAKSPKLSALSTKITRQVDLNDLEESFRPLKPSEKDQYIKSCGEYCASASEELQDKDELGFNVPIKLKGLIDELVIKSGSSAEFKDEVGELLAGVGLGDVAVRESSV